MANFEDIKDLTLDQFCTEYDIDPDILVSLVEVQSSEPEVIDTEGELVSERTLGPAKDKVVPMVANDVFALARRFEKLIKG